MSQEAKITKIRNFLQLECSIFSITKSCFKECLLNSFSSKEGLVYSTKDLFQFKKNHPVKEAFEEAFLTCVGSCSEGLIIGRRLFKERLMDESDRTQSENTDLFEGYYSEKKEKV